MGVREFLEVGDASEFARIAEDKDLVIRVDPLLLIVHYGLVFYINLAKLSPEERSSLMGKLRHKMVYVRSVRQARGITDLLKGLEGERS